MKQDRAGVEVYDRRKGITGVILGEDDTVVVVECGSVRKAVSRQYFEKHYTIVPQDKDEQVEELAAPSEPEQEKDERGIPLGEYGIGDRLRVKFLGIVKDTADQKLDILYDAKNKKDIVKYNGRNVFECWISQRRYTVMCHPDSLTVSNLKRATEVVPKSWGWSLRAKYVFTDITEWPLMKTIIVDGLYYRQKKEE